MQIQFWYIQVGWAHNENDKMTRLIELETTADNLPCGEDKTH